MVYQDRCPPPKKLTSGELATSAQRLSTVKKRKEERPQTAPEEGEHKKISSEQLEKMANRLSSPKKASKPLPPLVPPRHLSQTEEEQSVTRLYDQCVKQRRDKHEKKVERVLAKAVKPDSKSMDEHEVAGMVDRLYERSVAEKSNSKVRLNKKFAPLPKPHRLDTEHQTAVNHRMFQESCEKKTDGQRTLFEKYVLSKQPKMARRSKEECGETALRLSSRPGTAA